MAGLIVNLARIIHGIVSDSGQLFKEIQDRERDVQTDADLTEKEGLIIPKSLRDLPINADMLTTDTTC